MAKAGQAAIGAEQQLGAILIFALLITLCSNLVLQELPLLIGCFTNLSLLSGQNWIMVGLDHCLMLTLILNQTCLSIDVIKAILSLPRFNFAKFKR